MNKLIKLIQRKFTLWRIRPARSALLEEFGNGRINSKQLHALDAKMLKRSGFSYITILAALLAGVSGCTTSQQTTAYKTIGSIEATGVAAYDAYALSLAKGTIPTNSIPQVSAIFTQLQSDCLLAATVASQGTNGLATSNILTDATLLTSAIATAQTIK